MTHRLFASSRSWLCSAVILLAAGACKKDKLEVVTDPGPESTDYGRGALMAAVAEMAKSPSSAQGYRALYLAIEKARPTFNETVASLAERHLVFLALGPLEEHAAEAPADQMKQLALTVWPTAFRVEPAEGDTPMQYLETICKDELASECKHIVQEAWPVTLGALAWRRFRSRAREAYVRCRACKDDDSYEKTLERYEENTTRAIAALAAARKRSKPGGWPRAGEHAAPFSDPAVLSIASDGAARFQGDELGGGQWREAIRIRRGEAEVLGVHLRPTDAVHTLRGVLRDAARAGYDEIALIVREPAYPYTRREYRISTDTRRRRANVDSRDEDTIQVLVQALDASAKRLMADAGGRIVLRL